MMRSFFLICLVPVAFLLQAQTLPVIETGTQPEPTGLIFSHQYHLEEEGLECVDCHEPAEASTTGHDNLLPAMEVCADCHDVEDDDECASCHTNPDEPDIAPRITDYSQKFSHEKHLTADLTCQSCHAEVAAKDTADPVLLPGMVSCMDCHEDRIVDNSCETCHMPEDRLVPYSHTPGFDHTHGDLARHAALTIDQELTCQTCHQDTFCQDCHEGENLDRLTHPLNYDFTHALDAQANEAACVTCHTDTSFCIDCHSDNQVLPHSHRPGWVNSIPNDGGRHRLEALSDLQSCISCHEADAEQVCQPCHGGPN